MAIRRKYTDIRRKPNKKANVNHSVSLDSETYQMLKELVESGQIKSIRSGLKDIVRIALNRETERVWGSTFADYPRYSHTPAERLSRTFIPYSLHDEVLIAIIIGLTECSNVQEFVKQAIEEKLKQLWQKPTEKYYPNGEPSEEYFQWQDKRLHRNLLLRDDEKVNIEPYFENGEKMGYIFTPTNDIKISDLGMARINQDMEYQLIEGTFKPF